MHVVYTGEKVRIRPFKDFAEFMAARSISFAEIDPFRGPVWYAHQLLEQRFAECGRLDHDSRSFMATEQVNTGKVVGFEGNGAYRPGRLSMDIGTYILPAHRHRGFGIEAKQLLMCRLFECYPITSVHAATLVHHHRARAGLEAAGMHYFGRVRASQCTDGRFYDQVHYQIFREEWEQLPIRQIVRRGVA